MKKRHLIVSLGILAQIGGILSAQVVLNPLPPKILGQLTVPKSLAEFAQPTSYAPNLVEGKEFNSPQAVALDTSTSPPAVYVADTGNHRVLGWRDAASFSNGAFADVVVGQEDFTTTVAHGYDPGGASYALSAFSSGVSYPSSLAVDRAGNLFVMDAGNNRILRFPRPFDQPDAVKKADLVIGQTSMTRRDANQSASSTAQPDSNTIRTVVSGVGVQAAGITFDGSGNLWLTDAGNHRILRYPSSSVSGPSNIGFGGNVTNAVVANLVLGQADFVSAVANQGRTTVVTDRYDKQRIRFGGPLAFDAAGNLFFADDMPRVLVWRPPFTNFKAADRILGMLVIPQGQQPPPLINDVTFALQVNNAGTQFIGGPRGLFTIDNFVFVVDQPNHRVVRYDPVSTWPAETPLQPSPAMAAVFGQDNFTTGEPNRSPYIEPTNASLYAPAAGAYANGEVFLADSSNNRVLALPWDPAARQILPATRVLGQLGFEFRSPNLIEGREFASTSTPAIVSGTAITLVPLGPHAVIDYTSDPPRLYVADSGNNRILGFADARRAKGGDRADLVIGQVDFLRALVNSPNQDPTRPTDTGLYQPSGLIVDSSGNLWVADTGNGRVLRFPRPFDRLGDTQRADLVLGQPGFFSRPETQPNDQRLLRPVGLAFSYDGQLAVSDIAYNRVLLFNKDEFGPDARARLVLGQPDYESYTGGNGDSQLNLPLQIAFDGDDRLYVTDYGNARIQVFDSILNLFPGAPAAYTLNTAGMGYLPVGLSVSRLTGEIWVADGRQSRVLRFPRFDQLIFLPSVQPNYYFTTFLPRSLTLDATDNLFVCDTANRVSMHFPLHAVVNGSSGFPRVAPSMIALLRAPGVTFSGDQVTASDSTLPKSLADVEVLVNDVPSPVTSVYGDTVRFIVPKYTPSTGVQDFLIRRPSNGQILAYNRIQTTTVSPAVVYQETNPATNAQARAVNQDGSANSASKPALVNQELTVFLTGYGYYEGLPEDGVAPGTEAPVPETVRAFLLTSTNTAIEAQVVSSTLDPNEPGVWRVKAKVPQIPALGSYGFTVLYKSVASHTFTQGSTTYQIRALVNLSR